MTTSAQLNIGNIGAAPATTRTRTELSANADGKRSDGVSDGAFDAAMREASKTPKARTNDPGAKDAAASDDVAGHGEELPGDEISEGNDRQASAEAQDQNAKAKETDDQADQDTAVAEPDNPSAQGASANAALAGVVDAGVGGTSNLPTANAETEQAGVVDPTIQAAAVAANGGPAAFKGSSGVTQVPSMNGAAAAPISGAKGTEGSEGFMSFLQLGTNSAAPGETSAVALNQILAGAEQSGGVRGETGSLLSLSTSSNPVNAISAAQGQASPLNANANTAAGATPQVTTPFGHAQWASDVGQQVQWMMSQNLQRADIKLNPAHLGPIEVRIVMHHDQVQVSMTATHGQVREALESAAPRLRADLEGGGFGQASVDVGQQGFGETQGQEAGDDINASMSGTEVDDEIVAASTGILSNIQTSGSGLVDHYA